MFRSRGLAILSALAVLVGLGLTALAGSASAASSLSPGCGGLHSLALSGGSVSGRGEINVQPYVYAEGEQLELTATTDASDVSVEISSSVMPRRYLSGPPGQPLRFTVPETGQYAIQFSAIDEDAWVTWRGDCGLPPTPAVSSPAGGQTFAAGQNVPTSYTCTPQTNAVATCADSNGDSDGTGTLDTSTAGNHSYTVTGTDTSGFTASTTITYTVVKKTQTVSFTSTAPTGDAAIYDRVNGLGSYVPTGTSTSGLPVYFSVTSPDNACFSMPGALGQPNAPGVITIYWNQPGDCVVHANQPGDDTYAAAPEITQTVKVLGESTYLVAKGAKGALGTAPSTFTATLYQNFAFGPGIGSEPVAGETVTFAVGGTEMCSAVTNSDGVATCKKPIGLQKWLTSKSFTAAFGGSTLLQPTTTTQKWG